MIRVQVFHTGRFVRDHTVKVSLRVGRKRWLHLGAFRWRTYEAAA